MSLVDRILERIFHGDNGLAPRDWARPATRDGHQSPPLERTAMAPPADGKITYWRDYFDSATIMSQLPGN